MKRKYKRRYSGTVLELSFGAPIAIEVVIEEEKLIIGRKRR